MILTVRGVAYAYSAEKVLRDVSFDTDAGEIVCVCGVNGSGKTTLLDCVTGFLRIAAGEIRVCGKPLADFKRQELAKHVAYVPQQHHPTFPYLVRDVVLMGRTAHTGLLGAYGERDKAACEDAIRQTGIASLADRPYNTLSGGELRLVMLARALAQEPELIVLDEPTSSLDLRHELRFLETLTALVREKGIGALIATHDLAHAFFFERACVPVRTLILSKERPPLLGTPRETLTPQTLDDYFGVQAEIAETMLASGERVRQIITLNSTEKDEDNL